MAAATAATAVTPTASQAVSITLSDVLNAHDHGGTGLYADLFKQFGDYTPIIKFSSISARTDSGSVRSTTKSGRYLRSFHSLAFFSFKGVGGGRGGGDAFNLITFRGKHYYYAFAGGSGHHHADGAFAITFTDSLINGGAPTVGEVHVTAISEGDPLRGDTNVTIDRLTYHDTVPDQGSTLALLALGAGGVLAFRRRLQAAERK